MMPASVVTKYLNLRCTVDCTEVFTENPRHMEPNFLCIFCIKNYIGTQGEIKQLVADPALMHRVHVHPPCVRIHVHNVLKVSKHPECLGKLRMYSQYYKTEYSVHPEC